MKHRIYIFCILYLSIMIHLFPVEPVLIEKINLADLGIFKPDLMKVKDAIVYIWDSGSYKFYKLKELEVVKTFGEKGQGPGEYTQVQSFEIIKGKIFIYDLSYKMIEYDINGTFQKEEKVKVRGGFLTFVEKIDDESFLSIEIISGKKGGVKPTLFFNSGDKRVELASSVLSLKNRLNIGNLNKFSYYVGKDYCYVLPSKKNYYIRLFDRVKKKFVSSFENTNYERPLYSPEEIDIMKKKIEKVKRSMPNFSIDLEIPSHKPAIRNLVSDEEDNLFVITTTKKGNKNLIDVYGCNSTFLGSFYLEKPKLISVENGNIYLITESESYYLHIYKIKPEFFQGTKKEKEQEK